MVQPQMKKRVTFDADSLGDNIPGSSGMMHRQGFGSDDGFGKYYRRVGSDQDFATKEGSNEYEGN